MPAFAPTVPFTPPMPLRPAWFVELAMLAAPEFA
jgi:hypothetical protein